MSKEELLKYLIAVIDLIMHDKDYRFENRDGTWYSRDSCRDLTNEEVFEELKSELMQLNSQVEQIADLEAKLAEKEKEIREVFAKYQYYKRKCDLHSYDKSLKTIKRKCLKALTHQQEDK